MQLIDVQQWRTLAAGLPHWHYQEAGGGSICRELLFDDFVQAFSFRPGLRCWPSGRGIIRTGGMPITVFASS